MPTPTYPGVYVTEGTAGARPLEAASTSVAAFVGLADRGPGEPTLVTSWSEFQRSFGTFRSDSFLAHGVYQFFNNGGTQCYIVRVTRADAKEAAVTLANRATPPVPGLTFTARGSGAWGNTLLLTIGDATHDPGNRFRLTVRQQDDPIVVPADLGDLPVAEDFDDLSMDPGDVRHVAAVLSRGSMLIDATVDRANTSLQHGALFAGAAPALPVAAGLGFQISLDSDGFQAVSLTAQVTTVADVATAVQTAVRALTKKRASTDATAFTGFACTVEQGALVLRSGTASAASSVRVQSAPSGDAAGLLRLGSAQGARVEDAAAVQRPADADAVQVGDSTVTAPVTAVQFGDDGSARITDDLFTGAFSRLDAVTGVSLLAVPGGGSTAIVSRGMEYCAGRPLQDMFFLGETGWTDDDVQDAVTFRNGVTANSYGAIYFPWVKAADPTGFSTTPILLPPSGYIAGLYARIDASRGVWKAPAGTLASLNGTLGLATELSDVEQGMLNPVNVNVIRRFPGAGVVAFGARTVTADPAWRYVPVRRTAIMLRVSIYNGIQWAVFEPNDEPLWSQLRLDIGAFMMTLFRQQAFQGSTPAEAFFVKCDSETTTQADIDAGKVNVLVGFAPLKPAEFVMVTVSQQAGLAG
jgi:uncharacterized protein